MVPCLLMSDVPSTLAESAGQRMIASAFYEEVVHLGVVLLLPVSSRPRPDCSTRCQPCLTQFRSHGLLDLTGPGP